MCEVWDDWIGLGLAKPNDTNYSKLRINDKL